MDSAASLEIHVSRPIGMDHPNDEMIRGAIEAVLSRHGRQRARIGVAIVDDEAMATAHQRYLQEPGTTDVITFDLSEGDGMEGELMVCADVARREGTARGHGMEAELVLYVVHGLLHLLGYEDKTTEGFERIHGMENEVMESLGYGRVFGDASVGDELS